MRYFRMLSNSIIAGGTAAAYLVVLFLQLNPAASLTASSTWWLAATIWAGYGINMAAAFYALIVMRLVLSSDAFSPGWFSVRVLSIFCAGAAVAATALMWMNLRGFRATLDEETARRMAIGASAMTACAIAFVVLAVLRLSIGRRAGRAGGLAVLVLIVASIALPLAARGWGLTPSLEGRRPDISDAVADQVPAARVLVLAVDGASLDMISPAAADGRLPNFGRLLDAGATLHLATLRPTQPGPVLTAIATGKLPAHNGVRSAATYTTASESGTHLDLLPDFCFAHGLVSAGLLTESMQTADSLRARPLWSILGQSGIAATVVRWPLTFPAQPLLGALVTDQYHRASEIALALDEPGLTYPTELALELRVDAESPSDALPPSPAIPGEDYPGSAPLSLDRQYISLADRLEARVQTPLFMLRLQGLDTVSHYYLRQAMPRAFGDVSDEERRLYGQVLDQYYRFVDAEIGRLLDRLGPRDLLLVVSPFGMEPLSPAKRLLEHTLGNAALSGSHERAPDGFLMAYGAAVKQGRLPRGAVVDVTPTILYFLGRPVGRDMDGFARTDLFTRDFTASHPIVYIPTYER